MCTLINEKPQLQETKGAQQIKFNLKSTWKSASLLRGLWISLCLIVWGCGHKGLNAELKGYDYPYPVHEYQFQTQGQSLSMAYMDLPGASTDGGAKVVVMFHGKNFSGESFADFAKKLQAKGFRVLLIDQIGFGKSSKPQAFQFSFQELAADSIHLIASLGISHFTLVGHSMGGMLAVRTALMYPEKVDKLVLIDPLGLEDWKVVVPPRSIDQLYAAELQTTAEKIKSYQLENYYDGKWQPEYDRFLQIPMGWLAGPDYQKIAWDSALVYDMILNQPVIYELPLLRPPTVLIVGTRDRTALGKAWASDSVKKQLGQYPLLAKAAHKKIPHCRLLLLEGLGHVPFLEAPERFWSAVSPEFE